MATLLRNSLLAQSVDIDTKPTDLSQSIPTTLPNLPDNSNPYQANGTIPEDVYMPNKNKDTSAREFNKLYKNLQSDSGRLTIGNDPFLQKNAIDKVNEFLSRYPKTQISPDYNENTTQPWTDLPVKTLYTNTIRTLIDIINEVSDSISQNEVDGSVATRRKIVQSLFKKERRIYVGLIFIFLSFVLYFIDSAA
jgi:hypothetical protein